MARIPKYRNTHVLYTGTNTFLLEKNCELVKGATETNYFYDNHDSDEEVS